MRISIHQFRPEDESARGRRPSLWGGVGLEQERDRGEAGLVVAVELVVVDHAFLGGGCELGHEIVEVGQLHLLRLTQFGNWVGWFLRRLLHGDFGRWLALGQALVESV